MQHKRRDNMAITIQTMAKLALLPRLLEAATLLHKEGVIDTRPEDLVKGYMEKNPDINEALNCGA